MSETLVIALVGAGSALLGILVATAGQIALQCLRERPVNKLAKLRKSLLRTLLQHPKWTWRKLTTLSHIIGADESTTKILLIEIGARGSEDGTEMWGLISRNPFPEKQ